MLQSLTPDPQASLTPSSDHHVPFVATCMSEWTVATHHEGFFMLSDIAALATAIGVLAAVYGLLLSRRQARATFEHQFVQRYWELDDDRLRDAEDESLFRRRYLRLCEDEYEAMRLGQVSWRTWEVWHDAMRDTTAQLGDSITLPHEWLAVCLSLPDHPGSDCIALFAASSGGHSKHSRHLSSRTRVSPGRWTFRSFSSLQRRFSANR